MSFQSFVVPLFLYCDFGANQHTKSTEKHRLFRLIAPKQVKVDTSHKNEKKNLNLSTFSDTSVSFSHYKTKSFPYSGLFTNNSSNTFSCRYGAQGKYVKAKLDFFKKPGKVKRHSIKNDFMESILAGSSFICGQFVVNSPCYFSKTMRHVLEN